MGYSVNIFKIISMECLQTIFKVLEEARELDERLQIATLQVFLYVACNPGCSSFEIQDKLRLTQPQASRHLHRLGLGSPSRHSAVGRGLQLVRFILDKQDPRRRLYSLTPSGNLLMVRFGLAADNASSSEASAVLAIQGSH